MKKNHCVRIAAHRPLVTCPLLLLSALLLSACEGDTRALEEAVLSNQLQLASLTLQPAGVASSPLFVNPGRQIQFSVAGASTSGLPLVLDSNNRRWASSNSNVGAISDAGLFTALADGVTTVSVRIGGVDSTPFTINVSNAELVSVTAIDGPTEVSSCSVVSYSASGTFSDGSTRDLANLDWSINPLPSGNNGSDSTLGNVTSTSVEVEARAPGVFSVIATQNGVSMEQPVTVFDDLQSLQIEGVPQELSNNETVSLSAIATSGNGADGQVTRDVSDIVFWQVTAERNIAQFDRQVSGGQLTGLVGGTGLVEAFCGNLQAAVPLTVVEDNFVGFAISPNGAQTIGPGQSIDFIATATPFGDSELEDVTDRVEWSISNSDIAELDVDGDEVQVTGRRAGEAILVAEFAGERFEISITVQ